MGENGLKWWIYILSGRFMVINPIYHDLFYIVHIHSVKTKFSSRKNTLTYCYIPLQCVTIYRLTRVLLQLVTFIFFAGTRKQPYIIVWYLSYLYIILSLGCFTSSFHTLYGRGLTKKKRKKTLTDILYSPYISI